MIVCAGVVLASLDLFIVNVALPSMARDLHQPNLSTLSWVLNAYAIVYASLLVAVRAPVRGARPPERLPARRAGLHARLGGLRRGHEPRDADRVPVVQAAGAALLTPASLSLVLATTAPEKRHGAVRAWTAVGGAAAALGPVRRRPARRRELALGVLRQRPDRAGGA